MPQPLSQKIIFITGASSGIGKSCAQQFAALGAKLILTARRVERLEALAQELKIQYGTEVLNLKLDVRDRAAVEAAIQQLPETWKAVDVLINNAGLALATTKMQEGSIDDWETMIDTNVKGLLYVTRALVPGMVERKQGYIVNIGSTAGRDYYAGGNVYCATKHAVKAITTNLRIDLLGTGVRVSEVAPGFVHTEFNEVRWSDKQRAEDFYAQFKPLNPDDVARAIVFCVTQPPEVTIAELVITPTDQATTHYVNRKSIKESKGPF